MKEEIIYKEKGFYSSPLLNLDINGETLKFTYFVDIAEAVKRTLNKLKKQDLK